jgi:hypothetical protein
MMFSKFSYAIVGVALCAAPVLAQQAQTGIHNAADEAKRAARLFQEMKLDAQRIDMHAMQMEKLAQDPNTSWAQFDQEWNEIKPAQEMLNARLWSLDEMRASLSPAQRTAVDQTKQAAGVIAARTKQLNKLIDQPGAQLASPRVRSYAQSLAKNATTVAHAATGV